VRQYLICAAHQQVSPDGDRGVAIRSTKRVCKAKSSYFTLRCPRVLSIPTCSRPLSGVGLGLFVMRLPCCGLPAPARPLFSALRSVTVCQSTDALPGPCCSPVFRSAIFRLFVLKRIVSPFLLARRPSTVIPSFPACCPCSTYLSLFSSGPAFLASLFLWVVRGRAGQCRLRRLPAVVVSRSGLWFMVQALAPVSATC
jgi:hypothetical protein